MQFSFGSKRKVRSSIGVPRTHTVTSFNHCGNRCSSPIMFLMFGLGSVSPGFFRCVRIGTIFTCRIPIALATEWTTKLASWRLVIWIAVIGCCRLVTVIMVCRYRSCFVLRSGGLSCRSAVRLAEFGFSQICRQRIADRSIAGRLPVLCPVSPSTDPAPDLIPLA